MSNTVKFTEEDLKSGYQVQNPGFFDYEITKISSKPANTDGSPNYFVTFLGESGEMAGVRVTMMYSSKARFAFMPLFKAANGGVVERDHEYSWDNLVGCKVKGWTKRGDRYPNEITDFRPIGS